MLDFVINKRSIHLQFPYGRGQLCAHKGHYIYAFRKASEEEIAKYKLCGTCEKIARKRTEGDVPPLPFKPLLTDEDREIIAAALRLYEDYDHRARAVSKKFR